MHISCIYHPNKKQNTPIPRKFLVPLSGQSQPSTQTQSLIGFLSPQIRLVWFSGLHMNGIKQNKLFSVRLLFHNIMILKFIKVVSVAHSFSRLSSAPPLSILSPAGRHLGCPQCLSLNEATVNIHVQAFLQTYVFMLPGFELELYSKYMLNFRKNYQTDVQSDCTILHAYPVCESLPNPTNTWYYQPFEFLLSQWA